MPATQEACRPLHSDRFITPPDPAPEPTPLRLAHEFAPGLPRAVTDPFCSWEALTPGQRSKVVRNAGIVVARMAGIPKRQIASAVGLAHSRVEAIVGSAHAC